VFVFNHSHVNVDVNGVFHVFGVTFNTLHSGFVGVCFGLHSSSHHPGHHHSLFGSFESQVSQ
jgi:hypothetical protein